MSVISLAEVLQACVLKHDSTCVDGVGRSHTQRDEKEKPVRTERAKRELEEKESILIRKNSLGTSGMCMGDSEMFIVRETLEMVEAELVR